MKKKNDKFIIVNFVNGRPKQTENGRPKQLWRRTVIKELENIRKTFEEAEKIAKNRIRR